MQNELCDGLSIRPLAVVERPDDVHMDRNSGNTCSQQRNDLYASGLLRQRLIPAWDSISVGEGLAARAVHGKGTDLAEVASLLHERRFCRMRERAGVHRRKRVAHAHAERNVLYPTG